MKASKQIKHTKRVAGQLDDLILKLTKLSEVHNTPAEEELETARDYLAEVIHQLILAEDAMFFQETAEQIHDIYSLSEPFNEENY